MNPDGVIKFLDDLIRPGSRPFLVAFTMVLTIVCSLLLLMLWSWGKDERFNRAFKLGTIWIHLQGGDVDPSLVKASPAAVTKPYRKLLYIKVNLLANRDVQKEPFYVRNVARLAETDRAVPVFDESVYLTIRQFPSVKPLEPEEESSSGVVESRLLVPWAEIESHPFAYRNPGLVEIKASVETDSMYAISHFLNGLQGKNQTFCTFADADAESLRLVVDFSSIPNASSFVRMEQVQLLCDDRVVKTDNVSYERLGELVFTANCKDAKKGQLLRMDFSFNGWDAKA